jgi:hypothetical protein
MTDHHLSDRLRNGRQLFVTLGVILHLFEKERTMAEDKKTDRKVMAVETSKHDGAMSDPTVAATLDTWTKMTNKNVGKEHTLKAAADKTTPK